MIQLEFVFHVFCDSEIGAIKRMFGLTFFRKCFDVFVVENAFMQTYVLHEKDHYGKYNACRTAPCVAGSRMTQILDDVERPQLQ